MFFYERKKETKRFARAISWRVFVKKRKKMFFNKLVFRFHYQTLITLTCGTHKARTGFSDWVVQNKYSSPVPFPFFSLFISSAPVSTFPAGRDILVPIFYLVLGKPVFPNDPASRSRLAYSVLAPMSFLDQPLRCTSNDRAKYSAWQCVGIYPYEICPGLGGLAWVQEEERNGRKLMQAIMTIILNSLYIASSSHEKFKVFFKFFDIM